jgi:hypothetical protein
MNLHHQTLQLDVQVIDDPVHRIVNFTTGLFTDDRGRNLAAVRPPKLKRILALVILSILLFGGTAGVGSDMAYARDLNPPAASVHE